MMADAKPPMVQSVAVDLIEVINPRARSQKTFQEIVASIAAIGLKRPITVARRVVAGTVKYDLVCGQGRLEAFRVLGQAEIPAIVVEAGSEDCLVMSLVENLARRQHQALDLLHDIDGMRQRGHSEADIARKTGLTGEYVKGVIRLLGKGETRLIRAVESCQIPVSIAVDIAMAKDEETQNVLQDAYERNLLRGHRLIAAKRLVEQRRRRGKGLNPNDPKRHRTLSVEALVRTYQQDTDKKRMIVRKAEATRDRLVFVTEALRALFDEDAFVNLLRAEQLETLPRGLAERLQSKGTN